MKKQNVFLNHKFEKPTVDKLPVGENVVYINSKSFTDSFHMLDGTLKDGIQEKLDDEEIWADESPQFAVVFVSADGKGVMTHRFNALGYKHVEDFTEEELEDDKYTIIGDYVCIRDKKDNLVRIKDERRTRQAENFLNQFLNAVQAEEGDNLVEVVDQCKEEKRKLRIRVIEKEYDGKPVFDIDKFMVAESVPQSEGIESDDF